MRPTLLMMLIWAVVALVSPPSVHAQTAQEILETGKGHGVMGEPLAAQTAYERAAALGLAEAAHLAAQSHHYGWAGTRNFRKAASHYDQVIATNHLPAVVDEARRQRAEMLRELTDLAFEAARKQDRATSERYYNLAFELGDGAALGSLAHFYETGRMGWTRDEVKARTLYERQAEQAPSSLSLWALGLMYKEGRGGPADHPRAAAAFQAMINMGAEAGYMELAKLYLEGQGVPKDRAAALKLLQRPCDSGVQEACDLGGLTPTPLPGSAY